MGRTRVSGLLTKTVPSPSPILNAHSRKKPVATEIVYTSEPAIDNQSETPVFPFGTESLVTDVVTFRTDKTRHATTLLENDVHGQRVTDKLVGGYAQVEVLKSVINLLCAYVTGLQQPRLHQPQQHLDRTTSPITKSTDHAPTYAIVVKDTHKFILCSDVIGDLLDDEDVDSPAEENLDPAPDFQSARL